MTERMPEPSMRVTRWLDVNPDVKEYIDALRAYADAQRKAREKAERALCGLTPGGSEYANDPDACVAYVRRVHEMQHETILKFAAERDDARLEAENYRRVAKLCSLGHEQAEQRAAELEAKLKDAEKCAGEWFIAAVPYATPAAMQEALHHGYDCAAKLAAAEKDARRYRWWRRQFCGASLDADDGMENINRLNYSGFDLDAESGVDAAIDAAIERETK